MERVVCKRLDQPAGQSPISSNPYQSPNIACVNERDFDVTLPGTECYRIRPFLLYLGIIFSVLFATLGIASVSTALANADKSFPHPVRFALFFGVVWGAATCSGLLLLFGYFRERLWITPRAIVQQGFIFRRAIPVMAITHLKWHGQPSGGKVVVHHPLGRIVVYFANFTTGSQADLITYFRNVVPAERQQGWNAAFETKVHRTLLERAPAKARHKA